MFVCRQEYTKTTEWISAKLRRMGHGPRKSPFHFGVDPDKGADPGKHLPAEHTSPLNMHYSLDNAWILMLAEVRALLSAILVCICNYDRRFCETSCSDVNYYLS